MRIAGASRNTVSQYPDHERPSNQQDDKSATGPSPSKTLPLDAGGTASSADQESFHSFDAYTLSALQKSDIGKGKDIERGRTLNQYPRAGNPLERAESRNRKGDATIELDARSISTRFSRGSLYFEDRDDPCAILDDTLLEPCPHVLMHGSVSERIGTQISGMQSGPDALRRRPSFPQQNFNIHYSAHPVCETKASVQTCTSGGRRALHSFSTLAPETILDLSPNISYADYLELKLSSDIWSTSRYYPRRSGISVAANLPTEILHQIYLCLAPIDFNSARHACRVWYASSLEQSLLETMLKRGGWSSNIQNELNSNYTFDSQDRASDEWLMSKRLARECALGPNWSGNGLYFMGESVYFDQHRLSLKLRKTPLVRTSTTDFTEAGAHYLGTIKGDSDMRFTVSTCGNILMVAQGCLVMLYELNRNDDQDWESGSLRPVTSVICPRRVLACSMDTSSNRYAIAVLLDGRMGLVCDISGFSKSSRRLRFSSQPNPVTRGSSSQHSIYIRTPMAQNFKLRPTDNVYTLPIISADIRQSSGPDQVSWQDSPNSGLVSDYSDHEGPTLPTRPIIPSRNSYPNAPCPKRQNSISKEPSAPTLYAPLCGADDPPRSVALCPQRRCVAFGCSSGIELHWVDALTGQDLSRWFPLSAPSDYLYFLPPRAGVDNVKKLRLISSAGQPGERLVIADEFAGRVGESDPGNRAKSNPFWGTLAGRYSGDWIGLGAATSDGSRTYRGRDNSDHYRAIPLSDGYHILFTDPATGVLYLGSDAPIGGPNKLLRTVWFAGQKGQGPPVAYAAGRDLRWGVRVVAAYGHGLEQTIWLFSVPADIFAASRAEPGVVYSPFAGISSPNGDSNKEWMKWRSDTEIQDWIDPEHHPPEAPGLGRNSAWPVQIRGQEIGKCRGLADLAIDSGPEMTIWAFGREGVAQTWQIDDGSLSGTVRKRFVVRDGTIREGDAEGNIEMKDAPPPRVDSFSSACPGGLKSLGEESFDGTASMKINRIAQVPNLSSNIDGDGDILMSDLLGVSCHSERLRSSCLGTISLSREGDVQFPDPRFHNHSYVEQVSLDKLDLIDELTGVSRIEVEIR